MERKKMTADEIESGVASTTNWNLDSGTLFKRFEFANFAQSLAFVNQIGVIAEASDHHPDITFGWGYAEIRTTTHDRGGVTDVDFALVRKIDEIKGTGGDRSRT
ncbi:MAG TPA: 4a-hydroxytetrahydrobiopterin dehydratase [Pyrinomonadaceae bacterium]|nr:4a-hydroxytetrahydrobiopterin dehydratase [Pyrinomonadaceae bacterium]